MFLTLESAWKLLVVAIYVLLTFNSVARAQITPVPGGVSSIDNKSSLSSSTSSSINKNIVPSIGAKIVRPLQAVRPSPELPPVPPAITSASKEAKIVFPPKPASPKPASLKPSAAATQKAPAVTITSAPTAVIGPAASGTSAASALPQKTTTPSPTVATSSPVPNNGHDKFMSDLESELAGPTSADTSSPAASAKSSTIAASVSKNSALNPAQAKSFVVQASTTGEVPPSPPAPPLPTPPKSVPNTSSNLPAPKTNSTSNQPIPPKPAQRTPLPTSEEEFLPLQPTTIQKTSADNKTEVETKASQTALAESSATEPTNETSTTEPTTTEPTKAESKAKETGANANRLSASASASTGASAGTGSAGAPAQNSAAASKPKSNAATYMHIGDQPAKSAKAASNSTPTNNTSTVTPSSSKKTNTPEQIAALGHQTLESIEFNDVPLADAMKLFSEQSGLNVITSAEAGKARVTVFLKQVTALDALEAIVKANGLFYRVEAASGIVRIATSKEYEKDLSSFREEQTRVFTLLYPNPIAVAQVIQQVFGDRVQMNRADADMDDLLDLSRRFNRFDMVDGRSLGLGGANNTGSSGRTTGNNSSAMGGRNGLNGGSNALNRAMAGGNGLNGFNSPLGVNSNRQMLNNASSPEQASLRDLSADEIQQLENELAQQGDLTPETQADLLQRRDATIYISTIRRNNQIIVRTGDNRSMDQIAQLINQLDVPTPTVLLEVKVLRIVLADGFNSAFEYFGATGNASTAMSDGALQPAFPGASTAARTLGAGLGVAGGVPGSLSFQMVDDKFRVRMQLLESKNCVTALATPLILTANNEVSRIFVGDTLPFTVGFTPSQVLSSATAVNGAVAATPVTELRDVGQSLLITPNINADRTVTLRVIEENSERVLAGSSIPVPATSGSGVTNINVDTVRRRTISGTIVAQDGMAVALGGLIEEQIHDARDQVPVLGNIPGLGLLFRRQASGKSRSELVVIVRPYVFNTPTESAATTEMLLGELSTHPSSPNVTGTMNALPCPVTRTETESSQRAKLFQLHNHSLSPN